MLYILYCVMHRVLSDSESIDSDEFEKVLKKFFSVGVKFGNF